MRQILNHWPVSRTIVGRLPGIALAHVSHDIKDRRIPIT
jgi:hypothetical protein